MKCYSNLVEVPRAHELTSNSVAEILRNSIIYRFFHISELSVDFLYGLKRLTIIKLVLLLSSFFSIFFLYILYNINYKNVEHTDITQKTPRYIEIIYLLIEEYSL